MASFGVFIDSLTIQNWLTIVGLAIATFIGYFTVTGQIDQRRERKLKTYETTPEIKATINRKRCDAGWRSVQLHVVAPAEQQNFQVGNWCINGARLLRPWFGAVLARAENDDYATGVFYPDNPVRSLAGKGEGRVQRFALEFFIKFDGNDDKGKSAKFKVTFAHVNKWRRHIVKVWAKVPDDAE